MERVNSNSPEKPPRRPWAKLLVLAFLVALGALGFTLFADALSLDSLAERESAVRQFQEQHRLLVYVVAFVTYVAVTGLSLPGAAPLTLLYGWFFGFWEGLIVVSFASTSGATLAFLLSRYLLREWIQTRFGERLASLNQALDREGPFYLFTLRLIPALPFFVINVLMGLTRIPAQTFWWVSQLGMLAGTCAYVYAGTSVPDLQTLAEEGASGVLSPQLIVAFAVLGILPIVLKRIIARLRPSPSDVQDSPNPAPNALRPAKVRSWQ